jgi:hypothetical protein
LLTRAVGRRMRLDYGYVEVFHGISSVTGTAIPQASACGEAMGSAGDVQEQHHLGLQHQSEALRCRWNNLLSLHHDRPLTMSIRSRHAHTHHLLHHSFQSHDRRKTAPGGHLGGRNLHRLDMNHICPPRPGDRLSILLLLLHHLLPRDDRN